MGATEQDTWEKLRAPFPAEDIEWRVQQSGVKNGKGWAMVLAYVTNRAIQQRLDEVIGAARWKNEYSKAPDDGVLCGISILVPRDQGRVADAETRLKIWDQTEWVTKYDGAENTQVEAVKGGLSGAMKRAAVQWGIGRYLYNLESTFVQVQDKGDHWITIKRDGEKPLTGYWDPPKLPSWALPSVEDEKPPQAPETLTTDQTAELMSLAKKKGHTTKEGAIAFLNEQAGGPFTKTPAADYEGLKKVVISAGWYKAEADDAIKDAL